MVPCSETKSILYPMRQTSQSHVHWWGEIHLKDVVVSHKPQINHSISNIQVMNFFKIFSYNYTNNLITHDFINDLEILR